MRIAIALLCAGIAAAQYIPPGGGGSPSGAAGGKLSGTYPNPGLNAACSDLTNGGTACATNTGTSGNTVPLLDGANTWSAAQTMTGGLSILNGVIDFSAATHVLPIRVVTTVGDLSASGCALGELAIVSTAAIGQQMYENTGAGTCAWSPAATSSVTPPTPGYSPSGIISGGGVVWTGNLTFTVSAASYVISGVNYASSLTNLTLSAAHATLNRIDMIALDTTGAAVVVAGTPAASPAAPVLDPSTQLALTFITVNAAQTVPANIATTLLYDEDVGAATEWNATKTGAGITLNSTNNPYHGTIDIEGTALATGNFVQLAKGSGTVDLSTQNILSFYIRSKATWNSKRSLTIYWANAGTQVGTAITFREGSFGFVSSQTTSYQQIVIPVSLFQAAAQAVNQLVFLVAGSGGTPGFYLDWIQLQSGATQGGGTSTTSMNWRGAWVSTTAYAINDVVTSGNAEWIALAANTGVTPVAGANWALAAQGVSVPATVPQGGTGLATLTAHALYAGNTTSAPTAVGPDASTTKALFSAGSSADPAFRAIAAGDLPNVPVTISTSGAVTDPGGAVDYQFNNASGALTFNAPAGVAGLQRCYRNATGKSGAITIQMATSNTVDVNGANGSSAGTLVSSGALGDAVCIVSDAANHWYAFIQSGVWTNN